LCTLRCSLGGSSSFSGIRRAGVWGKLCGNIFFFPFWVLRGASFVFLTFPPLFRANVSKDFFTFTISKPRSTGSSSGTVTKRFFLSCGPRISARWTFLSSTSFPWHESFYICPVLLVRDPYYFLWAWNRRSWFFPHLHGLDSPVLSPCPNLFLFASKFMTILGSCYL